MRDATLKIGAGGEGREFLRLMPAGHWSVVPFAALRAGHVFRVREADGKRPPGGGDSVWQVENRSVSVLNTRLLIEYEEPTPALATDDAELWRAPTNDAERDQRTVRMLAWLKEHTMVRPAGLVLSERGFRAAFIDKTGPAIDSRAEFDAAIDSPPEIETPRLFIGASTIAGNGVMAGRPIAAGERILDFGGEVVDVAAAGDLGLPLQVGADRFMLASGLIDDLLNHSCDPNAGVRETPGRVALVALRDILAGEEVTFDYSTTLSNHRWLMQCECKVPGCRRVISDFKDLPMWLRMMHAVRGTVLGHALAACEDATAADGKRIEFKTMPAQADVPGPVGIGHRLGFIRDHAGDAQKLLGMAQGEYHDGAELAQIGEHLRAILVLAAIEPLSPAGVKARQPGGSYYMNLALAEVDAVLNAEASGAIDAATAANLRARIRARIGSHLGLEAPTAPDHELGKLGERLAGAGVDPMRVVVDDALETMGDLRTALREGWLADTCSSCGASCSYCGVGVEAAGKCDHAPHCLMVKHAELVGDVNDEEL